uniref:Apoptosis-associated speck-like protein containing a CARD n=1 Tax=Leptobrachium leishanense TaxID=445787 RepID=A0A8C5PL41_9ANUR
MVRTVRDVLVENLDELDEKTFKRFKNKLNDIKLKEEFRNPPRSRLETADVDDVASLILDMYMESYGVTVTIEVLKAIGQNQRASQIEQDLQKVPNCQIPSAGHEAAVPNCQIPSAGHEAAAAEPFVVRHRAALIQRMSLVDPILDELLSKRLISQEQYETARSMGTSQSKMRELYSYAVSWGLQDKEMFYQILRRHNEPLIRDLESSGSR